jgi:hypothetical protein
MICAFFLWRKLSNPIIREEDSLEFSEKIKNQIDNPDSSENPFVPIFIGARD